MSLVETQQIMDTIREIVSMIQGAELQTKEIKETVEGERGGPSLRQELGLINMYTGAVERWSGSSTLAGAMNNVQEAEAALLRFYLLMNAIDTLSTAPSIFGALKLGANLLGFTMTLQNLGQ